MKSSRARATKEKETLKPVDDRKIGKRKATATKEDKGSSKRLGKNAKLAKKDPNKPKRPPSAFFLFLEDFRETFKKENPNVKAVSAVGKAAGERWKSMSQAVKAPYEAKAAKKKADYQKQMNVYNNNKQDNEEDDGNEEVQRSKSEIHDDDIEESGEDEEEGEEEDDGNDED